ncbi:MAG: hypothetical protein ACYTGH_03005, partial [Planctomycetota bacterium]
PPKLAKLLPASGFHLTLKEKKKTLLSLGVPLQNQRAFRTARDLVFDWNSGSRTWSLALYLAKSTSAPLTLEARRQALAEAPQLASLLTDGITLELTDLKTYRRTALPIGRGVIQEASPENLNRWDTLPGSSPDVDGIRWLTASQPKEDAQTALVVELAMHEPDTWTWSSAMIRKQPVLALMPFLGLGLTIGAASWAFQRKPRIAPPQDDLDPEIRLVRRGNRSAPEESRMLVADFDGPGRKVNLQSLAEDKPKERDRLDCALPPKKASAATPQRTTTVNPETPPAEPEPLRQESNLLRLRRL